MSLRAMGGGSPPTLNQSHQHIVGGGLSDFKTQIPSREQLQFLNQQLSEALSEIVESVEHTQKRATSYIAGKQNDMYQIATSRTYNFPSQLKNEAIGLWYDAKTKVAQLLTDLKSQVSQKKNQIESNLVSSKIHSVRNNNKSSLGNTFLENMEAIVHGGGQKLDFFNNEGMTTIKTQKGPSSLASGDESQYASYPLSKILEENLRREIQQFKKRQEQHQKAVQKLRNSFRFKEQLMKEEQLKLQKMVKELLRVGDQQQSLTTINTFGGFSQQPDESSARQNINTSMQQQPNSRRANNLQDRFASIERTTNNSSSQQNNTMSPFEKKIATYQKSAERRKQGGGERSGSRSRPAQQPGNGSGSNFYPVMSNAVGSYAAGAQYEPYQNHPSDSQEMRVVRTRLQQLDNCLEDFGGKLLVRGQDAKDMDRQFDTLISEISKFSNTVEGLLNHHQVNQNSSLARNEQRNRSKMR